MAVNYSTYYGNYIKDLYESSSTNTNSSLYKPDPVLFGLSKNDDTYFDSCVASSIFKQDITGARFGSQSTVWTEEHAARPDIQNSINRAETELNLRTVINPLPVIEFSDNMNIEVNIDFIRSGKLDPSNINFELKNALNLNAFDITNFVEAEMVLKNIVKAVCKTVTVQRAFPKLYINGGNPSFNIDNKTAKLPGGISVNEASIVKATLVLTQNSSNVLDIFYNEIIKKLEIILKDSTLPISNEQIFKNFNPTQITGFKTPFYFKIRNMLISKITIPEEIFTSHMSDGQIMYLKRIIVETVLKTSYPLVQYLLIDGLINKYANAGDYVNVRIGYLAKLVFVYKFIKNIADIRIDEATVNSIYMFINSVIQSINNKTDITTIVKTLHQMSQTAVDTSQSLEEIKDNIAKSQIALGNIINNVQSIKAKYNAKRTEFWIVFSLIFVYILVTGLLIFFKMSVFAYFIIATIISIIFIYLAIKVIKMGISKN